MVEHPTFDFGTDTASVDGIGPEGETTSRRVTPVMAASFGSVVEWREVPAALFLSWSAACQFAYCAARDEDSAIHEPDAEWYRQRAQSYREMIHEVL